MTKPTVTTSTVRYALFRKGVIAHTIDYALRGEAYDTFADAMLAQQALSKEVQASLRPLIEVRVLEDDSGYRSEFGTNPLAWYSP